MRRWASRLPIRGHAGIKISRVRLSSIGAITPVFPVKLILKLSHLPMRCCQRGLSDFRERIGTGSKEARSACGTNVILVAFGASRTRGAEKAVIPAGIVIRKSRRRTAALPSQSRSATLAAARGATTRPIWPGGHGSSSQRRRATGSRYAFSATASVAIELLALHYRTASRSTRIGESLTSISSSSCIGGVVSGQFGRRHVFCSRGFGLP